jgi:DNA repair protein RecN (Recombination protein N)
MDANFYLKNLIIQNFATFRNQTIHFKPGFNAIVGETGSGKSLVLDALQLILGGRADKKIVRRETDYALIEASFFCKDPTIAAYLEEAGYPLDGYELIIKRLIHKNGTTKTYMNHLSCNVSFLATFSKKYIDLVGQFENQKLLSESYQLHLLDYFGKLSSDVDQYKSILKNFKMLENRQKELESSKNLREQRLDYLNYQLLEIEQLNPSSQDEEELLRKKNLMMNMEKSQKLNFQIQEIFDGGEGQSGLFSQLRFLNSIFIKNQDVFSSETPALVELDDRMQLLHNQLSRKFNVEIDPTELEGVLSRLDIYQKLKKKFGGTVETVIQSQVEFLKEKSHLEELDIDLNSSETKLNETQKELIRIASNLHQKRVKASKLLSTELTQKVRLLKMSGATVTMKAEKCDEFLESGMTRAFFEAETNSGEGFYRIKDIASGGELSRILLSVRQILSSCDSISIFLFDEIDTGIGGETATTIGKALASVALNGQVIAITHLPQIAQFAETLIIVSKDTSKVDKESRTESTIREISGKMIQKEVKLMAQLS